MTSRRCIPASRPSSVGVRWIAMYVSLVAVVPSRMLDGIRDGEKFVFHAEAIGQELAEPPHAERLRRVVATGHEVHAGLARVGHRRLGRLAGDEGVEPEPYGLAEGEIAAAGDHAEGVDGLGPGGPGEGLLAERGGAALVQLPEGHALARTRGEADRAALGL